MMGFMRWLGGHVLDAKKNNRVNDAFLVLQRHYNHAASSERRERMWSKLVGLSNFMDEHALAVMYLASLARDIDRDDKQAKPQFLYFQGKVQSACNTGLVNNEIAVAEFCEAIERFGIDCANLRRTSKSLS